MWVATSNTSDRLVVVTGSTGAVGRLVCASLVAAGRSVRGVSRNPATAGLPAVVPGIDAAEWTPRELRHSFVSLLSASGVDIEDISHLVGHKGTYVTELVYRHQLRPVIQTGAVAMDALFSSGGTGGEKGA